MILLMIDYNNILKTIYITPCDSAEAYSTERALASCERFPEFPMPEASSTERARSLAKICVAATSPQRKIWRALARSIEHTSGIKLQAYCRDL